MGGIEASNLDANGVEHMWLDELPDNSSIDFRFKDDAKNENAEEYVLKVRKPKTTHCPAPPPNIEQWLAPGWESPFFDIEIIPSKKQINIEKNQLEIKFDEDELRVKSLADWTSLRNEWVQQEKPAREAMKIYNKLYDLHSKIEQESEKVELLLGDGLFKTSISINDNVNHPLLLKKIRIIFNPEIPEFSIEEIFTNLEFYTGVLREVKGISSSVISEARGRLEENEYHPLEKANTSKFLKSLLEKISTKGKFVDYDDDYNGNDEFIIKRRPVLLLRTRTSGFGLALEAIIEDIKNTCVFPASLTSILGIEHDKNEEIRCEWEENPIDYSETKTSSRGGYSSRKIKKGDDENTNNSSQSEIKNNQSNFINNSAKTNYEQISIDLSGNSYKNIKQHNEKETENNIAKVVPLQVNNYVNKKVINNSQNTSLNGTNLFNNNSNKKIDILPLLKQKGYEVIDKREKGGAIWVVGGK